jgi:hypothetical protein
MMEIQRINEKQAKILKALGRYKFLTYTQMKRLGIDKHTPNLSNLVKELRERSSPFVATMPHRIGSEVKHYLTPKGKNLLMDFYGLEDEKVHCPIGKITSDTQDEKHRTTIISIQIEIDLQLENQDTALLFCDRYFDTVGNNKVDRNLKSKTAILFEESKSLKADMVFALQTPKQKELYLLELENGKDTQKAVNKCIQHGKAVLLGNANAKYQFQRGYRTLWIFEHEGTMLALVKELSGNPFFTHLKEYFLFKSLDSLDGNFLGGWLNADGLERQIFYV